jgi:hypothetical protein
MNMLVVGLGKSGADMVGCGHGRVRREIGIQRLLEWAFADECASVDFEDAGTLTQGYGYVGNAFRMAERGALGCRIDGGGRSDPDADADLVAAAVSVLPEGCGGRGMAVQIAELARARRVPDLMVGASSRCYPSNVNRNQHGSSSATEHVCYVTDGAGRKPKRWDVRVCPVSYSNVGGEIARARRNYLQWYSALLELRQTFVNFNNLSRWSVSAAMPAMRPWQNSV